MADDSAAWTLYNVQPTDNTFRDADDEVHRAFWRFIALKGVERFRWRCNAGLDRRGVGLAGIAESTRRKGRWRSHTGMGTADNPPLVPALGRSRTEDLIRGRGFSDHAEWYWATDEVTGLHWGQVMVWHREGCGGRCPVRDVIGWSDADIAWLEGQGRDWWYAYLQGQRVAEAAKRLELPPATVDRLHQAHGLPPEPHFEPQPAAPAQGPVPKIKVTGRVDIEHMTPGPLADRERTAKAIAEGYHSGFSRVTKGGPTIFRTPGSPPGPAPAPKPKPKPPSKRPAAAKVPAPLPAAYGVTFTPSYRAQGRYDTVTVDIARVDADLRRDAQSYVGPGGVGHAKPGSYEGFVQFLKDAREKGKPVEMPELGLAENGDPVVIDGRHRLAVFLAEGSRFLPVSVPKASSKAFRAKYGQFAF